MHTHRFVCRIVLITVWTVGIGYAGDLFGAKGGAREKGNKTAATDVSRELAMRPLPAYRIAPPDIIGIEVTGTSTSGNRSGDGVGKETVSGGEIITGNDFISRSLSKVGSGTLNLSGTNTGSTNVTGGTLILSGSNTSTATGNVTNTATFTANGDFTADASTQTPTPGTMDPNNSSQVQIAEPCEKTWTVAGLQQEKANQTTEPLGTSRTEKSDSKVARQPVSGQYVVAPDGTVNLRHYGTVQVMGKTVEEVKAVVRKQVSKYIASPEVSVEVLGYNSKVYYVITEGAGLGDNVRRVPITGNDTVLDALCVVNGLSQVSSKKIWIARPSPTNSTKGTILPVDYVGITKRGATATNYQIMPGDRIFVAEDRITALNNRLTKITMPIERLMGVLSLGASTIERIERLWPESPDDFSPSEEPDE
jgi:autotransporter-associated beta strand protein